MDTASPQDRYDAIQSRLTTIGGLAAELAAQASQALDAQAQVAESIESSYRQDLEQLRTAAEAVLHAVESLGPQQELFLTPALEGVAGALRTLATTLRELDGSAFEARAQLQNAPNRSKDLELAEAQAKLEAATAHLRMAHEVLSITTNYLLGQGEGDGRDPDECRALATNEALAGFERLDAVLLPVEEGGES